MKSFEGVPDFTLKFEVRFPTTCGADSICCLAWPRHTGLAKLRFLTHAICLSGVIHLRGGPHGTKKS